MILNLAGLTRRAFSANRIPQRKSSYPGPVGCVKYVTYLKSCVIIKVKRNLTFMPLNLTSHNTIHYG
jgi:hypothetical protein